MTSGVPGEGARVNYFERTQAAERYAAARPDIHGTALELFRAIAGAAVPFSRGLDVACGTGQSTVALAALASSVVGIDPSSEMLARAPRHPRVEYRRSSAERIDLPDAAFDVMTVAQAFHWLNQPAFLDEARRLLRAEGWLAIYTSVFSGQMREQPDFARWFNGDYLLRYPAPPRNRRTIDEEMGYTHGFTIRGDRQFSNDVRMTPDRFATYLQSTSNIIAAVESRETTYEESDAWIRAAVGRYFADKGEGTLVFTGRMWCLQKTAQTKP